MAGICSMMLVLVPPLYIVFPLSPDKETEKAESVHFLFMKVRRWALHWSKGIRDSVQGKGCTGPRASVTVFWGRAPSESTL